MLNSIGDKGINSSHRKNQDEVVIFTIVFQITILASKNMIVTTLQAANNFNSLFNSLITVLMGILYIRCLVATKFRIRIESLYIVLLSASFIIITYLFNQKLFEYQYVRSAFEIFLVYCIPLIFFIPIIKDTDRLLKYFYIAAYFMCITAIICLFAIIAGAQTVRNYSMSYGKAAMIPCIFLISKAFKEDHILDYILAFTCTVAIFVLGSRWPLLCIGAFLFYSITKKLYSNKKTFFPIISVLFITVLLSYLNYTELLRALSSTLSKIGINSRTLTFLLNDNLLFDSGRSDIHSTLLSKLYESPILGLGAFGGNVAVGLSHHFILDTWANFGFIFGSIILIYSILLTFDRYWSFRSSSYGELIMIYACMIWPKIMIGESFWSSDKYWMLISLIILGRYLKTIRISKIKEKE